MKSNSNLAKILLMCALFLFLAGLAERAAAPADSPLSKEDVTLLLLGGSPSAKIIQIVQERGVSFQMSPDLAKQFHDQGASDDLIDTLQKAGIKTATPSPTPPAAAPPAAAPANPGPPSAPEASSEDKPNSPDAPQPRAEQPPPAAPSTNAQNEPSRAQETSPDEPVLHTRSSATTDTSTTDKDSQTPSTKSDATADQKIQGILDGLAGQPETSDDAAVPLHIKDVYGHKFESADFKGKVVLINFWATWCPYCKTEIPNLVRLQDKYGWAGFQVVGIAVQDTEAKVKSYASDNGINYPVAMGDDYYKTIYGSLDGLPTCVFIGRDGRVSHKIVGAPEDPGVFEQTIQAMLKGPSGQTQMAQTQTAKSSSSEPVLHQPSGDKEDKEIPAIPATASGAGLNDPSPPEIQHIIQEFAAKEKVFRLARNNYTYHQINKVETLGPDNEITGSFVQEWDILYDDAGKRIEKVTYAPTNTLTTLIITKEDMESFRNILPTVLTTDELPDYDVKYLGHVKVDQITAYVFSIRPKEIQKNRLYFQGVVWVDDRDLQIVKSEGKQVPQDKTHHGQENLFPRFTTWREQVDGKFWFPTYSMGDDTLYFSNGPPIHMKEIVRYTDYKQFKSGSRILSVEEDDKDKPKDQTNPPSTPSQK
jgi:thiol-disulfide isomerase/thioredoxin